MLCFIVMVLCVIGFPIAGVCFKPELMLWFAFLGIAAFGALVIEILERLL